MEYIKDYSDKIKMVEITAKDNLQLMYEYRQKTKDEMFTSNELLQERMKQIEDELREKNIVLSNKQIIIGYEKIGILKYPIVIDMDITPHMLVCGLSNNGKTKMVEFAVRHKNVAILNANFNKDFKDFRCKKITDTKEMKDYLQQLLNDKSERENPLFVIIDELLVLSDKKEISKLIMDLLAVARHRNIYIIGISQSGEKEVLKYKHLFNARVCFRMVEESSYRTVLGYSPEITDLKQRQFLYYSDRTGMGYTYDVS